MKSTSASSFLFLPPLFLDMWPRVQLLCGEHNAPCQWDLAIDKGKPQHLQQNDRVMIRQICCVKPQDIVTIGSNELLAQLGTENLDLFKERRLHWCRHVGTLQWCSKVSLWHTDWWKACAWEAHDDMEAADRGGSQWMEALHYHEIWCESCHAYSKPATWKGAHWCGCCPCTCRLIKNRWWWWWWWWCHWVHHNLFITLLLGSKA